MKQANRKKKNNFTDDDNNVPERRILRLDEMRAFIKRLKDLDISKLSAEYIESILRKIIKMLNSKYAKYLTQDEKDFLTKKKEEIKEYIKTTAIGFEL